MKYLPKLVLLTLFASAIGCTNSAKKQKTQSKTYVPGIVESHIQIREKLKPFNDSISYFKDTVVFFSHLHPVMTGTDQLIGFQKNLIPTSRKDSLIYAASERLNTNYQKLIHLGYRDLFSIYSTETPSNHKLLTADTITHFFMYEDTLAVNYFNSLIESTYIKLDYL